MRIKSDYTPKDNAIHNGGECAFSIPAIAEGYSAEPGLTKREYFAALALQGLIASTAGTDSYPNAYDMAQKSVVMADALLLELEQQQ